MTKVCSLCGASVQSGVCMNALCRGFRKNVDSALNARERLGHPAAQSQVVAPGSIGKANTQPAEPYDSPQGTTIPRHIAGVLDNVLAWFLAIACAKLVPDIVPAAQLTVAVLAYLGYFLVFEAIFCTTPAKFMNGLVVRNFSGGRCTIRQTIVRTLFRLIEVNPALLGALPAAACILWSRNKQRLGDRVAGTVVVMR